MLGMIFKATIKHMLNRRMCIQPTRQGQGVFTVGFHTQRQGFQALGKNPRIEGAQARPAGSHHAEHFLKQHMTTYHGTTDCTALSV